MAYVTKDIILLKKSKTNRREYFENWKDKSEAN
jgi:hypothetical protein